MTYILLTVLTTSSMTKMGTQQLYVEFSDMAEVALKLLSTFKNPSYNVLIPQKIWPTHLLLHLQLLIVPVQMHWTFYCLQHPVVFDARFDCLTLLLRRSFRQDGKWCLLLHRRFVNPHYRKWAVSFSLIPVWWWVLLTMVYSPQCLFSEGIFHYSQRQTGKNFPIKEAQGMGHSQPRNFSFLYSHDVYFKCYRVVASAQCYCWISFPLLLFSLYLMLLHRVAIFYGMCLI